MVAVPLVPRSSARMNLCSSPRRKTLPPTGRFPALSGWRRSTHSRRSARGVINRRRGHRAIAQRLTALGGRLGVEPRDDNGKVESALSFLEEVTGAATIAVSESSAESVRLRRSLDAFPLGLVLCDEAGGVIFRNTQAEALMASRYGDAIAAQAVTEVLAEGWTNGVAERTN